MKPIVSVIIPVYNTEMYLENCIKSILSQTFNEFEVILVDDGSIDQSLLLCDKYSVLDSRITVIHQQNYGVASARNIGLAFATGDYISFLDSDDFLNSEFLTKMVSVAESDAFPICSFLRYYDSGKTTNGVGSLFESEIIRPTEKDLPCWRGLYKKNKISYNQLHFALNRKTGEDMEFLYRYVVFCEKVIPVSQAIYYYRCNLAGTMHTANYSHFDAVDAMIDTVKFAEEFGSEEQFKIYQTDLQFHKAIRIIEFATVTVISGGEKPKKVLEYLQSKGYHDLILSAFKQPEHYDSRFYKLYLFSPIICLRLVSIKKKIGKVLRSLKL